MFNIKYTPCSPTGVPDKMRSYSYELEKDMEINCKYVEERDWSSILHRIAKHHIEFEKIHPFVDGNGCCGRLLLAYEMILIGLLPVDIRYEERSRYYAALSVYDNPATNFYALSCTSYRDSYFHFNNYGNSCYGVAIGINTEFMRDGLSKEYESQIQYHLNFCDVIYNEDKQRRKIKNELSNLFDLDFLKEQTLTHIYNKFGRFLNDRNPH